MRFEPLFFNACAQLPVPEVALAAGRAAGGMLAVASDKTVGRRARVAIQQQNNAQSQASQKHLLRARAVP